MNPESLNFEAAMERLEEIVHRMEQGNVPLAESLRLFEEGTALVSQCNTMLDDAELKVVRLMKGPDGNPVEGEFDHE